MLAQMPMRDIGRLGCADDNSTQLERTANKSAASILSSVIGRAFALVRTDIDNGGAKRQNLSRLRLGKVVRLFKLNRGKG